MISQYLIAFSAFHVSAQDFDSQNFIQQYDQNKNHTIDEQEFEQVNDFAPYSYTNTFQGQNSHHKIFKLLELNHDGKLSISELQQLDQIIENQYVGWVWTQNANQVL